MKYISEQFKAKQNQVIRPPLKLYFEVNSYVKSSIVVTSGDTETFLDSTVAPIVRPKMCTNEHYYAVVGDGMPVDDPNRICAPNNYGGNIESPTWSVPYGITAYANANAEVTIGDAQSYKCFNNFVYGGTLSFKGGLIPEQITVEKYISPNWVEEAVIDNSELKEEVSFETSSPSDKTKYRRFKLLSSKAGRYQLNWIKNKLNPYDSVVFENDYIMSATIDEETDLTSQTLPSYGMTITCLDPRREYTPNSNYWNKQFACGQPCFFKAGYESGGRIEHVPLLYGTLLENPKYESGKITFKAAFSFTLIGGVSNFISLSKSDLVPGDLVRDKTFYSVVSGSGVFNSYDVFHGASDQLNSKCNYYGVISRNDFRQLVANAMGCFITAGINTIDLHNTNDIQYKTFDNSYLIRYEQSKLLLDSQPKVGSIKVIRNEYTLSENYTDVEAPEPITLPNYGSATVDYTLPFWAFGKYELVDAQASVETYVSVSGYNEAPRDDGGATVSITLSVSDAATIQPIFRFWEVARTEFDETEDFENGDDVYINDNFLVSNSYNAGKVKRVAEFMSNVSNLYEVDVIQDLSREVGDIIRLETQKNIFKTCVITGLKFSLPGSKGHISCRKVFSPMDCEYLVTGVKNTRPIVATASGYYDYEVYETDYNACIVAKATFTSGGEHSIFFLLGASRIVERGEGHSDNYNRNVLVTDDNLHVWTVFYFPADHHKAVVPVLDMGTFDSTSPINDEEVYGAMNFIMKLYSDQGMVSPVNYDSTYIKT